jgi:hypothetical protein
MLPPTPDLPTVPHRRWLLWAALLSMLSIGAAVTGSERSLGVNEVWAMLHAAQPIEEQFHAIQTDLIHPPLMYLLERAWLHIGGDSDMTAKALPLIVALPAIGLFTWLASRVTADWKLASFLFAAMFLRVGSPGTQVRMYGLALLWTVLAMLLWESWRHRPRAVVLGAWAATMVLLLYTHYLGALTVAAFLLVEWMYGSHRRTVSMVCVGIGLAFLPWILFVLPTGRAPGLGQGATPNFTAMYRALAEIPVLFLGKVEPGAVLGGPSQWSQMMALRAAVAIAVGIIQAALLVAAWPRLRQLWPPWKRGSDAKHSFWTFAILAGIPILLVCCAPLGTNRPMNSRYAIGALPAYILVLVLIGDWGGRIGRTILYGIVLPWCVASIGISLLEGRTPSAIRQGTLTVAQQVRDTDLVLCENVICGEVYWEWTRRLGHPGHIVVPPFEPNDWWFSALPQASLDSIDFSNIHRVWFLYLEPKAVKDLAPLLASRGLTRHQGFSPRIPGVETFVRPEPITVSQAHQ